jgi:Lipase (class 3)
MSFDADKARELVTLIGSAYDQFDKQGEATWSEPNGYNLIQELKHDRKRQVFGFIAEKNREVFIIIRGTRTTYEWYNNTAVQYEKYVSINSRKELGVTTKGFHSIYVDISEDIQAALQKLDGKFDRIVVAGHSLGGALATLAIPDLIDSGIDNSKIVAYTFASPRCCDRQLAHYINGRGVKHWRIANTEDIVPTLPGATANIFSPNDPRKQENEDEGNFIIRTYNNLKTRGMKTFEHTGTPMYFTIGKDSIEENHNLEFIYMEGIDIIKSFYNSVKD